MSIKSYLAHVLLIPLLLQALIICSGARFVLVKGDKCGNGSVASCDMALALECSGGVCDCKSGYTISRNGTKCLEVARYGLESPCEESIQCWKSLLGRLSECNIGTNKCSCYESDTLPIVYHQGRCYYGESLGEYCQIDGLCSTTTVHAVCKMGICQCKDGYVPSWDKSRCLPIATQGLNSPCEENIQCEKSPLGTLSECNLERMQCECYQIPQVPMVFHSGRCYFGAGLGDVCQVVQQCSSKVLHSVCGKDGKCRCNLGYVPNGNNTACLLQPQEPIASDGTGSGTTNDTRDKPECTHNGHCGKLGSFSRCNQTKRKCECYNPDNNNTIKGVNKDKEKLHIDNDNDNTNNEPGNIQLHVQQHPIKCHSTKYLGQTCKFHGQCSQVTQNSHCVNGICACEEVHFVPSEDRRKCLEIAVYGLNSSCDEDSQCTRSELGPLSYCNQDRIKCECSQEFPTVYHEGKCYLRRQLGATCESPFECKEEEASMAECYEGRCKCGNNSIVSEDNHCVAIKEEKIISRASSSSSAADGDAGSSDSPGSISNSISSSSSVGSVSQSTSTSLLAYFMLLWFLKIIFLCGSGTGTHC